jgi:hypothetical protein
MPMKFGVEGRIESVLISMSTIEECNDKAIPSL